MLASSVLGGKEVGPNTIVSAVNAELNIINVTYRNMGELSCVGAKWARRGLLQEPKGQQSSLEGAKRLEPERGEPNNGQEN